MKGPKFLSRLKIEKNPSKKFRSEKSPSKKVRSATNPSKKIEGGRKKIKKQFCTLFHTYCTHQRLLIGRYSHCLTYLFTVATYLTSFLYKIPEHKKKHIMLIYYDKKRCIKYWLIFWRKTTHCFQTGF